MRIKIEGEEGGKEEGGWEMIYVILVYVMHEKN